MKKIKIFTLMLILILLSGCGSASRITTSQNPTTINGKKINLQLITLSGTISITTGVMSSNSNIITYDIASSGEKQAFIAAQNLAFELRTLGFNLTNSQEDSEVVAKFSIGTIRYDLIAGWIADQAFLEFYDSSGQHILSISAKARFITPTVNNIVKNLVKELSNKL